MNKKGINGFFAVAVIIICLVFLFWMYLSEPEPQPVPIGDSGMLAPVPVLASDMDLFTVASWNLQIYGDSKASNQAILDFYVSSLMEYDVIFVQEIRDGDGSAWSVLCDSFPGYNCAISARDGRTSSKEQIGVIYNSQFILKNLSALSDPSDVWERSPIKADFSVDNYSFTVYNAHLKPTDVTNELHSLENAVFDDLRFNEDNKVIVLGDLNADCEYYNPAVDDAFDSAYWVWSLNEDTTVSSNVCAYDRIIVNQALLGDVAYSGVKKTGINSTYSDHYIIYVKINTGG